MTEIIAMSLLGGLGLLVVWLCVLAFFKGTKNE